MDKLISGRNWFHPYHMATLKPQDAHGAQLNFVPNKTLCNAVTVHSTLTTTLWTSACTAPCTTTAPCTAPLLNPTNTALLPDRHRTLDSSLHRTLHSTFARPRHRTLDSSRHRTMHNTFAKLRQRACTAPCTASLPAPHWGQTTEQPRQPAQHPAQHLCQMPPALWTAACTALLPDLATAQWAAASQQLATEDLTFAKYEPL